MPSLADEMAVHDAVIADALGELATIGSNEVKGFFYRRYREIDLGEGAIVGVDLSFDCRYEDASGLTPGDEVTVQTVPLRFVRYLPEGGDESGWCTLELGRFLS